MASSRLGIDVPDVVEIGLPFAVRIVGADDPRTVMVRIADTDTDTDTEVAAPALRPNAGALVANATIARPGLYRLGAHHSGGAPVFRLFLAVETRPDE